MLHRAVERAKRLYPCPAQDGGDLLTWDEVFSKRLDYARHWYRNPKKCSCSLCGNPRRIYGDSSRREKLAIASARDELNDLLSEYDVPIWSCRLVRGHGAGET